MQENKKRKVSDRDKTGSPIELDNRGTPFSHEVDVLVRSESGNLFNNSSVGSLVNSASRQGLPRQGVPDVHVLADAQISPHMAGHMNMQTPLSMSDTGEAMGMTVANSNHNFKTNLTAQLEASLMQHYFHYGYRNMPVLEVDETRMRYRTSIPSPLPAYLIATLVAIGSVYCSLLDSDITHADSLQLYHGTVNWLIQTIDVTPASIDFLTAMVLLL